MLDECENVFVNANSEPAEKAQAMRDEAFALAEAIHQMSRLANAEVRRQLTEFVQYDEGCNPNLKIGHKQDLLNSFDASYWCHTMTHLFFRDDCRETYECHGRRQLKGRRWAKLLQRRVDFRTRPGN